MHPSCKSASPPWTLNQEIHLDLFQTLWCPENLTTGLFLTTMPITITTPSSNTLWSGTLCTATEYSLLRVWTHSCTKWYHQLLMLSPQPIWWKLMNFSVLLCKFLCSQRSFASTFSSNWKVMAVGLHSNCKRLLCISSLQNKRILFLWSWEHLLNSNLSKFEFHDDWRNLGKI